MAENMRESSISLLEQQAGGRLLDIKLFRGNAEVITEEEIWEQIHSALLQEKRGAAKVTEWMDDPAIPVNVQEFLSSL